MLKCLLYRHFVAPEIWHLSCDKPVLKIRIECFHSTFCSRESNIQSEDHVMQMDKFIFVSLCIFKNLDKNICMFACAKVWGKIKVGSPIALLGHESSIVDEQTEVLFTLPASQARYSNIYKEKKMKLSRVIICSL